MIVEINGGLGNQIFQYALLLQLQQDFKDQTVIADLTKYDEKGLKKIDIERAFDIDIPRCSKEEHLKYGKKYKVMPTRLADAIKVNAFINAGNVITEKNYLKMTGREETYFRGYWQSEKYFSRIKDNIEKYLSFRTVDDQRNMQCIDEIGDSYSVSLHIRRGDYLLGNNPSYFVNLTETEYYKNAIAQVLKNNPRALFFVFSDDVLWCKTYLPKINAVYVEWNGKENAWVDMYLMSKCKAHIVANSSFSWWGAYLSPYKTVFRPESVGKKFERQHPDYYPKEWIVVPN